MATFLRIASRVSGLYLFGQRLVLPSVSFPFFSLHESGMRSVTSTLDGSGVMINALAAVSELPGFFLGLTRFFFSFSSFSFFPLFLRLVSYFLVYTPAPCSMGRYLHRSLPAS